MNQLEKIEKNENKEIHEIKNELRLLKSLLIGLLSKDFEGEYKTSFIKEMLSIKKEKKLAPTKGKVLY